MDDKSTREIYEAERPLETTVEGLRDRVAELETFVREFDEDVQRVVSAGRPLNDVRIAEFSRRAEELLKR